MRQFGFEITGATAIEYAMIASLVAMVILAIITQLGQTVNNFFAQMVAPFV